MPRVVGWAYVEDPGHDGCSIGLCSECANARTALGQALVPAGIDADGEPDPQPCTGMTYIERGPVTTDCTDCGVTFEIPIVRPVDVALEWREPVNETDEHPEVESLVESAMEKLRAVVRGIEDREQIADMLSSMCTCRTPNPVSYLGAKVCRNCKREIP